MRTRRKSFSFSVLFHQLLVKIYSKERRRCFCFVMCFIHKHRNNSIKISCLNIFKIVTFMIIYLLKLHLHFYSCPSDIVVTLYAQKKRTTLM